MVREMGAHDDRRSSWPAAPAPPSPRSSARMKVTQEIDALTTMGISPLEFLVLPRMLALCLMMPLLCLYADLRRHPRRRRRSASACSTCRPSTYFHQTFHAVDARRPRRRRLQGVGLRRADRPLRLPARHAVRQQRLGRRRRRDLGGRHRHRLDHLRRAASSPSSSTSWASEHGATDRRRRDAAARGAHHRPRPDDGLRQLRAHARPQLHRPARRHLHHHGRQRLRQEHAAAPHDRPERAGQGRDAATASENFTTRRAGGARAACCAASASSTRAARCGAR